MEESTNGDLAQWGEDLRGGVPGLVFLDVRGGVTEER